MGHGNELGLIEHLELRGISGIELTKALGLWHDGDSAKDREQLTAMINIYIRHRWNLRSESELKEFLILLSILGK